LLVDEEKEEKHFSKIDSLDKDKDDINIMQISFISNNTAT